jgi:hypothetical protein
MKEIQLTKGFVALIDDEDYDLLIQFNWHVRDDRNNLYAATNLAINGRGRTVPMHRIIMNTPLGLEVDHRDHNGLNNQKHNLRNCTRTENGRNCRPKINCKSKYKGVKFDNKHINGKVYNYIRADIQNTYIGSFKTEEDAARAYDKKAIELYGEFANLNLNT